jgi:lipopolysaccharide export system permease protein
MKKITKTILVHVLLSTLMVSFFVLLLQLVVSFLNELSVVGQYHYTFWRALFITLEQVPLMLYQILPMTCFLGTLLGLGQLASRQELMIMQVTGYSVVKILRTVAVTGLLLAIIMTVMVQCWGYNWASQAEMRRAKALQQSSVHQGAVWFKHNNSIVHVDDVKTPARLNGVTRFDFDSLGRLVKLSYAPAVDKVNGQWVMQSVKSQRWDDNRVVSSTGHQVPLGVLFNPAPNTSAFGLVTMYYGLSQLHQMIEYQRDMGLSDLELRYDYWQQLLAPIMIVLMMVLAVPFVLQNIREVSVGLQILKGVLIGFGVYVLNIIVGRLCMIIAIDPFFAALIPELLIVSLFFFKIRKKV